MNRWASAHAAPAPRCALVPCSSGTRTSPPNARRASAILLGIAAQSFALLGTLVGIFIIIIGIGPRTVPDVVYHVGIVIVLVCGLVVAARTRS